jgi:DNA-binding protein H-NS
MTNSKNLSHLSIEALTKLRDDVAAALSRKAEVLQKELVAIGSGYAEVGRIAMYGRRGRSALKGRKVAVKYRDKSGNTWTGRGAPPRWMTAAIKAGAKRDDFLVDRAAAKKKKTATKKVSRKKARRKK